MPFTGTYSGTQACIANMSVVFLCDSTIEGYAAAIAADPMYALYSDWSFPTVMIITNW